MAVLIFFFAHHYFSLFFQTFFQHRYAAHAAFRMGKGWEKTFFILTWITQGSSYLSPRAYAVMHRLHHAHADTDQDPHSPSYSKNLMDMMLKTWRYYAGIYSGTIPVEAQYKKNVPDWKLMDRIGHSWASRLFWVGFYIWFYVSYASSPWLYALIPIHIFMSPVHGAIINWYAHKYGYENYDMKNTSENLFHVDILMLGEGYHNNHHKHASRPNFGVRWHEIDPVYPVILLFNKLGIIRLNKFVPDAITGENRLEKHAALIALEEEEKDLVA